MKISVIIRSGSEYFCYPLILILLFPQESIGLKEFPYTVTQRTSLNVESLVFHLKVPLTGRRWCGVVPFISVIYKLCLGHCLRYGTNFIILTPVIYKVIKGNRSVRFDIFVEELLYILKQGQVSVIFYRFISQVGILRSRQVL